MTVYSCFDEAYPILIHDILHGDHHQHSPRGFGEKEKIGVSFKIMNPIKRGVFNPERKFNLPFSFAEALWYLSGQNDLAFIEYYAPSMRRYSNDGVSLPGTGYGKKIFSLGHLEKNQWAQVARLILEDDRDTKRAVVQIFDGQEDLTTNNLDVCCTLGLQFLMRDGKLDCVGFMRANDFFKGIVSDVFSFTILQECMARELGAEVGTYHHMVGSAHIYNIDENWAQKVLDSHMLSSHAIFDWPQMPPGSQFEWIAAVLTLEKSIRSGKPAPFDTPVFRDLPRYWQEVTCLFVLYADIRHERAITSQAFELLNPTYKLLLRQRWPEQFLSQL